MIDRCYNVNRKTYQHYGGRGIKVCDEWINNNEYEGIENFINWAKQNGYSEGLSIERINVNGNYEPSNCKWITMEEQARNKTNTIYININNENDKLIDLSNEYNINRQTILRRYEKGIMEGEKLFSHKNLKNNSGFIGVCYSNDQNNWRAYININKKRIELGRRKDKEEAIKMRLAAELKYFGKDFAPQRHLFEEYGIGGEINE